MLLQNPHALSKMKVFINICSAPWVSINSALRAMDIICVPERRLTGIV